MPDRPPLPDGVGDGFRGEEATRGGWLACLLLDAVLVDDDPRELVREVLGCQC